jgi:hexosaminidase
MVYVKWARVAGATHRVRLFLPPEAHNLFSLSYLCVKAIAGFRLTLQQSGDCSDSIAAVHALADPWRAALRSRQRLGVRVTESDGVTALESGPAKRILASDRAEWKTPVMLTNRRTGRFLSSVALLLGLSFCQAAVDPGTPPIIPRPAKIETSPGTFELTEQTIVIAGSEAESEARTLADVLRVPTGFPVPVGPAKPAASYIALELDRALESTLGSEGYLLSVQPTRVSIRAAGEAGLFYGGVTLRQLLPSEIFSPARVLQAGSGTPVSWSIPCLEVQDRPRLAWRGLLIDVARHYMPVEFLKKAVDLTALHKLNMLQLHLTDDQGWRLEIRKYPRLTQVGSVRKESPRRGNSSIGDGTPYGPYFYTQAQIRELVSYAQARHVTILPEIEMPGHFLSALAAYPQFSCRGGPFEVRTRWGVEPDILCAGSDQAIAFAKDILAEVIELFPSRFIHIGGDEAPRDRWKTCPKCQARLRAEGLKSEAELQTFFNHRVEEFLTSRGRRLIGWDEILEGGLTPGAAVMSWRGISGGIAAAKAGHDVVMSPTSHCYFDYLQSKEPGEPKWIGGYIPLATVYAYEPIPTELPPAQRVHVLGAQGNVWTEFLNDEHDVEYFAFPRAVALAEVVWSPTQAREYSDFCRRLEYHQKRLDQLHVNYRKLDAAAREGK